MIQARFFIGDYDVEYAFNELDINKAINDLSMMYYEKKHVLPISIFLSYDLYKLVISEQYSRYITTSNALINIQYMTSNGIIMVKPVPEPKERLIYAGNQQGYENSLIDKKFEEIFLDSEE